MGIRSDHISRMLGELPYDEEPEVAKKPDAADLWIATAVAARNRTGTYTGAWPMVNDDDDEREQIEQQVAGAGASVSPASPGTTPSPAQPTSPVVADSPHSRPGREFIRISGPSQAFATVEAQIGMPIASVVLGQPMRFALHRSSDGWEVRAFAFPPSHNRENILQELVGALGDGGLSLEVGPIGKRSFRMEGGTWRMDAREPTQLSDSLAAALRKVRR